MVQFLSTMVVLPPSQIPPSTAEQEAETNIALARMSRMNPPPAYAESPTSPTTASPSLPTAPSPTHLRPVSIARPVSTVDPPPSPPPPPLPPTPVLGRSPSSATPTPRQSTFAPTVPDPVLLQHEAYPDAVPIDEPLPAYSRYPKRSNSSVSVSVDDPEDPLRRGGKHRSTRRIFGVKLGPMMSCLIVAGATVLVAALVAGIMQGVLKRQLDGVSNDTEAKPTGPETVDVEVGLGQEGRPTGTSGEGVAQPTPTMWVRMA